MWLPPVFTSFFTPVYRRQQLQFRAVRFCQELDVHKKKRKSDHQYFLNHQRRQPRDLGHLAVSQSQSVSTLSPRGEAEFYQEPVADDDELPGTTENCSEDTTSERTAACKKTQPVVTTTQYYYYYYYTPQSAVRGTKSQ